MTQEFTRISVPDELGFTALEKELTRLSALGWSVVKIETLYHCRAATLVRQAVEDQLEPVQVEPVQVEPVKPKLVKKRAQ